MIEMRTRYGAGRKRIPGAHRSILHAVLSLAVLGAGAALAAPAGPQIEQSVKKGAQESAQEARKQQELGAQNLPQLTAEEKQRIENAIPQTAQVHPKRKRKLLVVTLNIRDGKERRGHTSIPFGNLAIQQMGEKTGSYETVFSNDINTFSPANLKQFDAICFNNTGGVLFEDAALRESLLSFVRNGKGFIGFHAAGATFVQYPKYDQFPPFGDMLGGYENGGHPWGPKDVITMKVEDPASPVNAAFGGKSFEISDEVFQFQAPYSREKLHILLGIDTDRTDMDPKRHFLAERAKDHDFGMSWIRRYGKGRVFYSSLGHNPEIWSNPPVLQHFLAGIQYALGDLKADDTPSAALAKR